MRSKTTPYARLAVAIHLALAPAWLLPATGQAAPGSAHAYHVPAGPLANSLARFASEAGVVLSFDAASTQGKTAPALEGNYSVEAGFATLLAGSQLQVARQPSGVYLLLPALEGEGVIPLGVSQISGTGLGEVTEQTGSYTTGAVSVGKTRQSIKELPQTVSVITRQRLEDQQLTTVNQAMAQTTGISLFEGSMTSTRYLSRGFEITNFRIDGGASIANGVWKNTDTAIYDHIEVLRGADGLYAGAGEPGGTLNFVRKRPTLQPQASITTSAGRWDDYRTELDASGPLAFDGKLRGRAVVVSQNKQSFIDYAGSNHDLFYGVLEADLTDSTNLFVGLNHDRYRDSDQAYGLPRYSNGDDLKLPRSTFLAGANDYITQRDDTYFATLKQQLGEQWSLNVDTLYTRNRTLRDYYNFNGAVDPATGAGVSAEWGGQDAVSYEKSVDVSVRGNFEGWGLQHNLVAGWMWHNYQSTLPLYSGGTVTVPNIFSFSPADYPSLKGQAYQVADLSESRRSDGVYANLRLQLAEPLHWIIGASLTNYRYDYSNLAPDGSGSVSKYNDSDVLVPYTGLTYALTPEWTAYASVSEIYKSQADRLAGPAPSTRPLDPITGRNYEVGLKGSLWGGRVNTYAALYYVKREGDAVRDPAYPTSTTSATGASCCYLREGQVLSKGLDVEVSGELWPRVQATLGYTYNQIDKRSSALDYTSLTPKHLAKLYASYQLPGAWQALKVGGGATLQSASYVEGSTTEQATYSFSQAGYSLWNAFAHYDLDDHWGLALNIENLFDKHYYSTIGYSNYANFYGEPRRYVFSLSGRF
ncbi:TonB-dependent siderophore receptor [Pseudomonas sp. NPDC007930]|uniref:TonB-dependent siderophore receptor n=1 Tax=Pseudomonas sp. NPDC007930 TaxID=3364417 RepID=UPI0036EE5605